MKNKIILLALMVTTSIISMDYNNQTKIDKSKKNVSPSSIQSQNLAKFREILITIAHIRAK